MLRQRGFEHISEEQWKRDIDIMSAFHYKKIMVALGDVKLPQRATRNSAGYDIFSPLTFRLNPEDEIKIPLGWKTFMLPDEVFYIFSRSSLGFKYIRLANTTGVIDSDYYNNQDNEGHCFIKLRNEGQSILQIEEGEAIAQGVFSKFLLIDNDIPISEKRTGGEGSTNKK